MGPDRTFYQMVPLTMRNRCLGSLAAFLIANTMVLAQTGIRSTPSSTNLAPGSPGEPDFALPHEPSPSPHPAPVTFEGVDEGNNWDEFPNEEEKKHFWPLSRFQVGGEYLLWWIKD